MEAILQGEKLLIVAGERIDSSNSEQIDAEILLFIKEYDGQFESIVIDANNLVYVSSAGLRVLLKYKKLYNEFSIVNTSVDVYSIFEMTGFTQILTIKRKMKKVSIEGCEEIGKGFAGTVYRLNEDTIVKVYNHNDSLEVIEKERELAKKVFMLGVPTAISYDVVEVEGGGYGSVFELVKSRSMAKLLAKYPENEDKYVSMACKLIKSIGETIVPDGVLPQKKDLLLHEVDELVKRNIFKPETNLKIRNLIDTIPYSNHLVHGDCHVKNIMIQDDEPLLIDMSSVGTGHLIFEINAYYLTYIGYPETVEHEVEHFLGIEDRQAKRFFYDSIDYLFPDKTQEEKNIIVEKCQLVGNLFMLFDTLTYNPEKELRIKTAIGHIDELTAKYDDLNF